MFRFFKTREWVVWAYGGGALIIASLWYQVQVNVKINEWFGDFYDLIGQYIGGGEDLPPAHEYWDLMWQFGWIAGVFIVVAVITDFFTSHYVFRWRKSMTDYYIAHWSSINAIEGEEGGMFAK